MAVGEKHGSAPAGTAATEPPTVHDADGRRAAAAIDGLLRRVARGDAKAFARVCDQVSGAVYGLVRRIVVDQSQAEQVAAEVLVDVWRSASHFSPAEGSGLSWVITIARHRAMSQASAAGDGRTANLAPSAATGMATERSAGSLLTHHVLASLPRPQQQAVLLASCGYTWRQAAVLAGVPAGTAAERLREGLLELSSHPE